MHDSCMQPLLDADVSVHDDMQGTRMSKSSCLFTASPLFLPLPPKKSPDLRKSRGSSCWTLGGPDPWTPGQRRPCSYSSLATL